MTNTHSVLGSLPEGWSLRPLGDITSKIGSGATPRGGASVYVKDGPAFIRSMNVHDHRFAPSGLVRLDQQAADALRGVTVESGDVLMNITGDSILRCCVVPDWVLPARVSQHVAILRSDGTLLPILLQKFLTSAPMKQFMLGHSSGATRNAVTKGHIERFLVPVPPMAEQLALGSLFQALDEKTESNQRMMDLLHAVGESLCQRLLAQHPYTWEHSWPDVPLGERLSVLETGGRPRGGVSGYRVGIPSIGAESIVRAGSHDFSKTKFVPDAYYSGMSRGQVQPGDVLLYKDGGTPGNFIPHVSMTGADYPFSKAAINEHVYRLRVKPPYSQALLYFWLASDRLDAEMRRRGTGVAIPGLNSSNVRALPLPDIPVAVLQPFQALLEPLVERLFVAARENRQLAEVREALLPELMSGRIRVPVAEKSIVASV